MVGTRLLLIIFSAVAGLSFLGFKGWTGADLVGDCGWIFCPTFDSIPHSQGSMRESAPQAVVKPAVDRTVVMITPGKRGGGSEGQSVNGGQKKDAGPQYNLQDVLLSEEDEMREARAGGGGWLLGAKGKEKKEDGTAFQGVTSKEPPSRHVAPQKRLRRTLCGWAFLSKSLVLKSTLKDL